MSHVMEYKDSHVSGSSQKRRKSRRWIWATLSVVALLIVLAAAGAAVWYKTVGAPLIASDGYYGAIRHQEYATAYTYLGSSVKAKISRETFIQAAQQVDTTAGKVSALSYGDVYSGDPATSIVTVTRANGTTYTVHLELRQEGGAWKITSYDHI